jgi:hypothetical protein
MKKIIFGMVAGLLVATAVGAYQAEEHKSGSPMGGMMQGTKPMMGEQKPGDQSQEMMQGMKEMMAKMSKMMDMCSQMMASHSDGSVQKPSEKK